jgi:hypothetical protein
MWHLFAYDERWRSELAAMQSRIGGGVKAVNGEVGVLIYVHAAAAKRVPRFLIAGPVCAGFLAAAHGILPSTGIYTDETFRKWVVGTIEKLSSEDFEPQAYRDEYRKRVLAMIDEKVKGQQITIPPPAPAVGHVIRLMADLKESMRTAQRGKKRTEERKRKKA